MVQIIQKWDGDFSIRQLPRGSAIIGQILNITKKETGKKQVSLSDACWEVANELYDFWVYIGNVYPKYFLVIKDQINNDCKEFVRQKNYPTSKRSVGGKWENDAKIFDKRMHTYSYDIRTTDTILHKNLRQTNAYIFI